MRDTCWLVSCSNYGHSTGFCQSDHGDGPFHTGSEGGCYS